MAKRTIVPKGTGTNDWQLFLDQVELCAGELTRGSDKSTIWYRGQPSATFDLMPGLFRSYADPNGKHWNDAWQLEQDLFWEFSARARQLHGSNMKDWDILFAMQHHGTPTRLLDWTEVLGVAVYFAIQEWWRGSPMVGDLASAVPCVWLLEPYRLNMAYLECDDPESSDLIYPPNLTYNLGLEGWDYSDLLTCDGLGWDDPVAIWPRQQNDRIHAQRGWFTMHGDSFKPINKHRKHKQFLRKVDLPITAIGEARKFMDLAGLNHYAMFPDLTNLSKHLKETLVP